MEAASFTDAVKNPGTGKADAASTAAALLAVKLKAAERAVAALPAATPEKAKYFSYVQAGLALTREQEKIRQAVRSCEIKRTSAAINRCKDWKVVAATDFEYLILRATWRETFAALN